MNEPVKTEDQLNLEKVRDDKVFPIAREVLKDFAKDLIPEDANVKVDFGPVTKAILEKSLEADLNITMDVSYLFQVLNGALSGLNTIVQGSTTISIDDVRFGIISRKILGFLAEDSIRLGTVTPEETQADFSVIKEKVNVLFAEEKLTMIEVKYIMDNIFESFTAVSNMFHNSLEASSAKAEAKLFGIESMSDLSMKKLNEVLMAEIKS